MPTFSDLLKEIRNPAEHRQAQIDTIRQLADHTGRPVVLYAAATLKRHPSMHPEIHPHDVTLFSDVLEGLTDPCVDIVLHSGGGSAEVTEQIVEMLRGQFQDIRFIVPNRAMSAATLMTLSGNVIGMDNRSSLGPIDPQIPMPRAVSPGGPIVTEYVPAQTIIDGLKRVRDIIVDEGPTALPAFLPMLEKYDLHLFEICQNAIDYSKQLARTWLRQWMFADLPANQRNRRARTSAERLARHSTQLTHGRPIGIAKAEEQYKLEIFDMREDTQMRELVWRLYCLCELGFERMPNVYKVCENSEGTFLSKAVHEQLVQLQIPGAAPPPSPTPPSE